MNYEKNRSERSGDKNYERPCSEESEFSEYSEYSDYSDNLQIYKLQITKGLWLSS